MKKPGSLIITVIIGIILAGTLTSCEEFFTTSWGSWAARDKDKLASNVDASNVGNLVSQAKNDPDLSLALLKKISDLIDDITDPAELLALRQGALDAAANASGLVPALMKAIGDIAKDGGDDDAVIGIVANALDSLNNLGNTADYLYEILNQPGDLAGISSGSLVFGAAMLAAADAKNAVNNEEYPSAADFFDYLEGETKDTVGAQYKNTILAMEIASELADVDTDLGTFLEDLGLR